MEEIDTIPAKLISHGRRGTTTTAMVVVQNPVQGLNRKGKPKKASRTVHLDLISAMHWYGKDQTGQEYSF